jgi:hypothetical protein
MHISKWSLPVLFALWGSGLSATLFAESSAIPAGTQVTIRTVDRIESRQAEVGGNYRCSLDAPILVAGKEVAGRGADCILRVTEMKGAGKLRGTNQLKLELSQIRIGKDLQDVNSDPAEMQSGGKGKSTSIKTGIGAAAGAGLGGVFGGKKGAAIGAGAGAGAGLATSALTHGPQIKVAPETVLKFVIQ